MTLQSDEHAFEQSHLADEYWQRTMIRRHGAVGHAMIGFTRTLDADELETLGLSDLSALCTLWSDTASFSAPARAAVLVAEADKLEVPHPERLVAWFEALDEPR